MAGGWQGGYIRKTLYTCVGLIYEGKGIYMCVCRRYLEAEVLARAS